MKYLARIFAFTLLVTSVCTLQAAEPAPSPIPVTTGTAQGAPAKTRPISFHGPVAAVNEGNKTITIGKKKLREIHITAQTKFLKGDGKTPATWEDVVVGTPASGSYKKSDTGELDAVTFKVGPKS